MEKTALGRMIPKGRKEVGEMPTVEINGRQGCDHWRKLTEGVAARLRELALGADCVVHPQPSAAPEADGRLHVVLGLRVPGTTDPADDRISYQPGQGVVGLRVDPHADTAWVLPAIERVLPLIALDPAQAERARAEALARNRQAYVRECGRRLANTMKAAEEALARARQTIERAQREIVEAVRAEAGNRKKLEQLRESSREQEARFALEYDRLLSTGVEKVEVADGIVRVLTTSLKVEYGGSWYRLGRYRIEIQVSGSRGVVRCFNLDHRPNGYHHPHVQGDGSCCLGNIADGVARLLGEYEFAALAGLMVQFLRTVNPGDWYTPITNWPLEGGGR